MARQRWHTAVTYIFLGQLARRRVANGRGSRCRRARAHGYTFLNKMKHSSVRTPSDVSLILMCLQVARGQPSPAALFCTASSVPSLKVVRSNLTFPASSGPSQPDIGRVSARINKMLGLSVSALLLCCLAPFVAGYGTTVSVAVSHCPAPSTGLATGTGAAGGM